MNPARGKKTAFQPARVTAAVLTYLPNEIGYFQDRFDVTRTCIESIITNTHTPYDLMVFDNGSCARVVDYLREKRDAGQIDFLILSDKNIGKLSALKIMFQAAPGTVIAYCDDDIFFLPGWLQTHLKIIDTFPDVGLVSGMYIKSHMKEGISATIKFGERADVVMERGNLISEEIENHYMENMGRTRKRYLSEIEGLEDVRLTHQGISVFASAGHYQFVAKKNRILEALPADWNPNLMGEMRALDRKIDELGYLRVCTTPATLRLLGNQINQKSTQIIRGYGIDVQQVKSEQNEKASWKARFLRAPLIQKIAYFFYERLFKIINT